MTAATVGAATAISIASAQPTVPKIMFSSSRPANFKPISARISSRTDIPLLPDGRVARCDAAGPAIVSMQNLQPCAASAKRARHEPRTF